MRRLGAVADAPPVSVFRKVVYDLVAVVELRAALHINKFWNFNAGALEEFLKLALLRLQLAIVGEIGVDHSRHNALRDTFNAVGRLLHDLDKTRLDEMLLLFDDLRLDLLARPCAWNENDASVAEATEPVAAIDVLCNVNR